MRCVKFTALDKRAVCYLQEAAAAYSSGFKPVKTKFKKETVAKDYAATETQERVLDLILRSK